MDQRQAIESMRLLHGELDESAAQRLREQMAADPDLRESYETLKRQWSHLQLPEPDPAPPGFATRVLARAKEGTRSSWVPGWWSRTLAGRLASAAVLAGGIAAGAVLVPLNGVEEWSDIATTEPSLAETYLIAMQESDIDPSWEEGQ